MSILGRAGRAVAEGVSWRRLATVAFAAAAAVLGTGTTASCETHGQACAPGDFQYCSCVGAPQGYQQCLDDGSKYGACDCSGTIPQGAGILVEAGEPAVESGPSDGGLAGFLEPCGQNEDCLTGNCYAFNAYGPHCTRACTKDNDCPPPSPGCSNNRVCKLH